MPPVSHQDFTRKPLVRLYTRTRCHLCDAAKAEMARADCAGLFALEEIDIDTDPELVRRFGYDIPVVEIEGAIVFKHRLTAREFRRELLRAQGKS